MLISISDNNLSFIIEEHLSWIFFVLDRYDIRLNLMQNSAVSFSICVDNKRIALIVLLQNSLQSLRYTIMTVSNFLLLDTIIKIL